MRWNVMGWDMDGMGWDGMKTGMGMEMGKEGDGMEMGMEWDRDGVRFVEWGWD